MQQPSIQTIREYLANQYNLPDDQIDIMMPSFLSTMASHMDSLEQALSENNAEQAGRAAHTIKGAFLNLGLSDCAELARQAEHLGKSGQDIETIVPLVQELRLQVTALLEQKNSC